jgi:hypothetical protein
MRMQIKPVGQMWWVYRDEKVVAFAGSFQFAQARAAALTGNFFHLMTPPLTSVDLDALFREYRRAGYRVVARPEIAKSQGVLH